jgi:transposase
VTRKTIRFVPVKSADQQAAAIVLKTRALLVNQRTQVINALRGHLSEFGIIAAAGTTKVAGLISIVRDKDGSASSEGCPSCLNGSRQPDRRVEGADRETRAGDRRDRQA